MQINSPMKGEALDSLNAVGSTILSFLCLLSGFFSSIMFLSFQGSAATYGAAGSEKGMKREAVDECVRVCMC